MEHIDTILCPVDFTEFSERALQYATAFAQQYHARLIVYHSEPLMAASAFESHGVSRGIPVGRHFSSTEANEQLENFVARYAVADVAISSRVDVGFPAERILNAADEENADLIVMGTHGLSGYEAVLMGSVTNKVLYKAKVPVLVVCKPTRTLLSGDPDEPLLIGRILCAVDPVRPKIELLSRAMSLARSNRASILFFAVQATSGEQTVLNDLKELIVPEKETQCRVQFLEAAGNPVEEILKAVETHEIDMLVMGHRSITPLEVLGSVTLRVIPRSPCPVLVLRD